MIDETLSRDLEHELNKEFPNTKAPLSIPRAMPKPVDKSPEKLPERSLSDQWVIKEKIEEELRDRIRKERLRLLAEHDDRWASLKHDYASRISEAVTRLERERDAALRKLVDSYQNATRDLDFLAQRIGN